MDWILISVLQLFYETNSFCSDKIGWGQINWPTVYRDNNLIIQF